jgi:hypothetical protein
VFSSFSKTIWVVERAHICNTYRVRGFSDLQEPSKVFQICKNLQWFFRFARTFLLQKQYCSNIANWVNGLGAIMNMWNPLRSARLHSFAEGFCKL